MPATISAVLITYNDAARIRPCLESVRWADEIIVLDLSSTDSTVAICHEFTERVYTHEWLPYADPVRNDAISLAGGDWIIMLDADERVTSALATELRLIVACDNVDVVLIPYWFMSFGHRRTDPLATADAIARFFRKGAVQWPADVHARPDLTGLRQLRLEFSKGHYILHDSWQTSGEVLDKVNRYTMQEAQLLHSQGVRFSVGALTRETLREMGRGLIYSAHRNGVPGLISIGFTTFYRFCVWTRLWELEGRPHTGDRQVQRWGEWVSLLPRRAFYLYRTFKRR